MGTGLAPLLACFAVFVALWPSIFITFLTAIFYQENSADAAAVAQGGKTVSRPDVPELFYHLGGNGPWIPKVNGATGEDIEPPAGCRVSQVHMLSRHAERYPTVAAGARTWALYQRLQETNATLFGDLKFATDWEFFMDGAAGLEQLVSTGRYAGTLEAFATGVKLRSRYKELLDETEEQDNSTTYWTSDSARVIDTAKYFAAGFFGVDTNKARLEVIPETMERGADTLTPGRSCPKYRDGIDPEGHAYGYRMMDAFRSTYEPAIASRLAEQNPDFPFTEDEIFTMQIMCGFETIAKGSSPWCDVFTADEWDSFEYTRDVIHYYRSGPGNPYGPAMGWLWLNATTNLLAEGEEAGSLFFSFVHDGDIFPLLAALDIFPQIPDLPVSHILHNRTFRTSDIVPMGGRIILEQLVCPAPTDCWSNAPFYPNHVYCAPPAEEVFVRVNVNDGIVAIPGCDDGPGRSCSLEDFIWRVQERGKAAGDFRKVCGLSDEAPDRLTFLHQ